MVTLMNWFTATGVRVVPVAGDTMTGRAAIAWLATVIAQSSRNSETSLVVSQLPEGVNSVLMEASCHTATVVGVSCSVAGLRTDGTKRPTPVAPALECHVASDEPGCVRGPLACGPGVRISWVGGVLQRLVERACRPLHRGIQPGIATGLKAQALIQPPGPAALLDAQVAG